jgi:prephenate dehydrogenase
LYRYTFYLDFLASEYEDRTQNALMHLKEQSDYVRVLGSYPKSSQLIGPIKSDLERLDRIPVTTEFPSISVKSSKVAPLKIGIIGFGKFGQFLAKTFVKNHLVYGTNKNDVSGVAQEIGVEYFPMWDLASLAKVDCDVILVSVSIISFEEVLSKIPKEMLKGKLVVDVLSVKMHARDTMLALLPPECDILCTHPMFGPESGKFGWQGMPFLYDKIRINDVDRCERFLSIWEAERCKMIEMSCEQHDEYAANSQFITHLTGRILGQQNLSPTPIDTKGFQTVLNLVENTCKDSFDLFFGLYFYNTHAASQLQNIREALSRVERQLAAKEAYLTAKAELSADQRSRILEECRALIRDVLTDKSSSSLRTTAVERSLASSDDDSAEQS